MSECPICMELIKDPVFTPCLHSFCKTCLDDWVNEKRLQKVSITCPCCRYIIENEPLKKDDSEDEHEPYNHNHLYSSEEEENSDSDARTDWDPDTESIADEEDIYDYDEIF